MQANYWELHASQMGKNLQYILSLGMPPFTSSNNIRKKGLCPLSTDSESSLIIFTLSLICLEKMPTFTKVLYQEVRLKQVLSASKHLYL